MLKTEIREKLPFIGKYSVNFMGCKKSHKEISGAKKMFHPSEKPPSGYTDGKMTDPSVAALHFGYFG